MKLAGLFFKSLKPFLVAQQLYRPICLFVIFGVLFVCLFVRLDMPRTNSQKIIIYFVCLSVDTCQGLTLELN